QQQGLLHHSLNFEFYTDGSLINLAITIALLIASKDSKVTIFTDIKSTIDQFNDPILEFKQIGIQVM
ncbi:6853_t:CDS:2, partial [Entrophospora sp. SA101]